MKEIVIATRNKDKRKELEELLKGLDIKVLTLDSFPKAPEVEEDDATFEENAAKKAVAISRYTKGLAIADDSGLEVEALGGAPGVYSARFAGSACKTSGGCTYADNNRKLLRLLNGTPKAGRKAQFVCAASVAYKGRIVGTVRGVIKGYISDRPKGNYGFGYDPVFIVPKYKKTFAELGKVVKNKISHRSIALRKAKGIILKFLLRCR